jgi:hypothetical protein
MSREPTPREFRYKITAFVDGVLTLDVRVLRYRQGLRRVQVPYANIRGFGLKRRGKSLGGVVTSELLLRTEPAPGQVRLVNLALDPDSPGGKDALAALHELLPDADTTKLPWEEAAARLGVKPYTWRDGVVSRWGMIGTALVAAVAGVSIMQTLTQPTTDPATLRVRAIVRLVAVVVGVALLAVGMYQARRPRR